MLSQQRPEKAPRKTVSTTSAAAKKRNTARACEPCRRRKSKCDGGTPSCSNCRLYHDDCTYSSAQDGRRPAPKAYVQALEERIRVLEALLKDGNEGMGLAALDEDDEEAEEDKAQTAAVGLDRLKLDEETNEFLAYGPTSAFQHLPQPTRQVGSPTSEANPHGTSPSGASYSGAGGSFFDRRTSFSIGSTSPRPLVSPLGPGSESPSGPLDWSRNLPDLPGWDQELHDDLIDRFFCYLNSWCLFVDEPSFRADMVAVLSYPVGAAPSRTSSYSPLLHCAILAIVCSFKDDPRLSDGTASQALARRAKAAIDEEGERPTLSMLQGLLLLGSWHTGASQVGLAYLYAGIGLRLTFTLGLGIDCSAYVDSGVISAAVQRRRDSAFFCAYLQDKLWSIYAGRIPTILRSSSAVEIALPAIDPERDRKPWSPLPADFPSGTPPRKPMPSFISSTFHWTCRLGFITEKIMTAVYALRAQHYSAPVLNKVSELNLELETWLSSLPFELRIAPQTSNPPPPHIITLNTMYHFAIILLNRPYYLAATTSPVNEVAVKRCSSSATRIVALFELYQKCPGLRFAPISATQIGFAAGTTHLLALVNAESAGQQKKASDSRAAAASCVAALREMGRAWRCANTKADILLSLIEKWSPEPKEEELPEAGPSEPAAAPATSAEMQLAAVQALDPHSDLAKELLRLGWTPPTAPSAGPPPAGPPAATAPELQATPSFAHSSASSAVLPSPFPFSSAPSSLTPHLAATSAYGASYPAPAPPNPALNPYAAAGLWPFFPTPPSVSAAPPATASQSFPLADDIFAGTLSSEARPALDALGFAGQLDLGAAFGNAQDFTALASGALPQAQVTGQNWVDAFLYGQPQQQP
ncbi:hypothetical protein JCM8097_008444 [Rhodosporidiobolus ruineniae]